MQDSLTINLCKMACLAFIAVLLGLISNAMRDQPVPLNYQPIETRMAVAVASISGSSGVSVAKGIATAQDIGLEEVIEAIKQKRATIIDARPPLFFRMGCLPGAINLPRERFQAAYLKHPELSQDTQRLLIIYCHSATCEDSHWVAKGLLALNHENVAVFAEGWQAWQATNQPVETGR